jgi:hypothetical protein
VGFVGEGSFGDHDINCIREPDHDRDHKREFDGFNGFISRFFADLRHFMLINWFIMYYLAFLMLKSN